ncbi:MAG: aldo/keto reductase, partial [Pollutimonas bauzanensis]|uniref:Aldo/keto reductase n=1 Tax=Pollutimonas bauzanensis TaxID=658167 RepID=A0A1M5WDD3_9BURK|nr:aldo/keto reductase [Pollutimonas bauzanensis]SHH85515.1 Aldo/keto reductase [Pollutimonas bauzanensis]
MVQSPTLLRGTLTRAQFLRLCGGLSVAAMLPKTACALSPGAGTMNTRPIPSTGEALPVVGCGTYRGFDHGPGSEEYARLPGVLESLLDAGGKVVDTAAIYGRAERSIGEILDAGKLRGRVFLAGKVWSSGREAGLRQMRQSMQDLRTDRLDLMQVHNLVDWRTQLSTLRLWQAEGRIRYIGITHYESSAHRAVEAVLRSEPVDFLQINYSMDEPDAAARLFPLAADRGVAVVVNRPFGGGGLMRRLRGRPLPGWAGEIGCSSWAQVLIKFVLSQAAVSCVIPGTGSPEHMRDNAAAGRGPLPEADFWRQRQAEVMS